ncbi:hypothetical protein Cme02nite_73160 [Catellatospora methionotrophica]|uniref:Uncharacterized protein n=1 Tax=Catellatospora methionotrophica TaxID=121620 RepID=A0A8J3LNV3_9ACTN|nr:hypothetical protein [Catellatospora methionotrophica]GIG18984.1 hypothetical protein Cme02nite_73160 [Catellatospora methionotrophica]
MLRLTAVRHFPFDLDDARPSCHGLAEVFAERLAGDGVPADPAAALVGNRNSFSLMSAHVAAQLCPDPDVVLVGHAAHDCDLSTSVAGYLQQRLPGDPLVLAVSEQGATTGFAALTMARALHDTGAGRRILVVLADQATFTYDDPRLSGLDRRRDHAVGLLFTDDGGTPVTELRVLAQVDRQSLPSALAAAAKEAVSAPHGVLVAGAGLSPADTAAATGGQVAVRHAAADRLTTAVWSALADELAAPATCERTVVAVEYEPDLGYLSTLALTVPPAPTSGAVRD